MSKSSSCTFIQILLLSVMLACISQTLAGQTVTVNPSVRHQVFEGWGVSICWWGNQIGGWSEQNRNNLIENVINPDSGLGYTVYRFNIGGGENPSHTHMTEFRDMPSYQPSRGVWDWNADSSQRNVMLRLIERGKALGQTVILEAFSNSPPYWMTVSGCASGATSAGNNLAEQNYQAFADYLAEVVRYYRDTHGVTFRTLDPLNEPDATWWTAQGSQEGCTFRSATQSPLIEIVGRTLANKGLTGTKVSAPDETSIDTTISSINMYSATALSFISQINTHSYSGTKRTELKNLAAGLGKRLWQSESGPLSWPGGNDNDVAIYMANRIITDLREMQPVAWLDWQVVDGGVWGSIHVDQNAQSFSLAKRFYMHRNFSNFIRPGSQFIEIANANMVAALSPQQDYCTIVVLNSSTSSSAAYTLDLSAFQTLPGAAAVYRTSANENLARISDISISNKNLSVTVPAYSITTLRIPVSGSVPTPTPEPGPDLAQGKTATADSEESGNTARAGNDGNLSTRWCANDGSLNHWWKVDLGNLYHIAGSEVNWEVSGRVYQYLIEVSTDNSAWTIVADRRNNTTALQSQTDEFSVQAWYVRITITGLESGIWASFYEFRVFEGAGLTQAPSPAPTASTGVRGDANGNGSVDIVDALLVAQYYVGLAPQGFVAANADTNCSGSVDIVDALLIAQYYVGLITRFC